MELEKGSHQGGRSVPKLEPPTSNHPSSGHAGDDDDDVVFLFTCRSKDRPPMET